MRPLCMGGECPYTCCKDWNILIDDNTYENYMKEPGILGLAVKACSRGQQFTGHCKFHTREGLCYFQKNNRMDLMPKVCQVFPRRVVDFGEYGEMTYYMSCYNIARDFVADPQSFALVEADEEADVNWPMGNHDSVFLEYLYANRDLIIRHIHSEATWRERLEHIYSVTYAQTIALTRQEFASFDNIKVIEEAKVAPRITPAEGYLFYPVHFLNDLILNHVMNSRTCRKGTYLYGVIQRYRSLTGGLTEREADKYVEKLIDELYEANKSVRKLLDEYLSYMIVQDYIMSYEDYYVVGPVLTSIASAELFILLCATENHSGQQLDTDSLAALLANLEKASRSSATFDQKIIEKIRSDYF